MSTPNGIPQKPSPPPSDAHKRRRPTWLSVIVVLVPVIVALISFIGSFIINSVPTPPPPTPLPPITSWYPFEESSMDWQCERNASDVSGCTQASRSDSQHHDGSFSLEVVLNLVPGSSTNAKAEVRVVPPEVNTTLLNQTISAWVYMPQGALGDPENPNGLHLFVKDSEAAWRSLYGCWIRAEEGWNDISLTISTDEPECANDGWYMTPGFDPTHIRAIGVSIGTPEQDFDQAFAYQGPIYVDQVELHR